MDGWMDGEVGGDLGLGLELFVGMLDPGLMLPHIEIIPTKFTQ